MRYNIPYLPIIKEMKDVSSIAPKRYKKSIDKLYNSLRPGRRAFAEFEDREMWLDWKKNRKNL